MAITAILTTSYGESRELYVRLNNLEASNHGLQATALFRGFISKDAFDAGKGYVWEREVSFAPDVAGNLWPQAYAALKGLPLQELPEEPQSPATPSYDASDDEKAAYETAKADYDSQHDAWESEAAKVEADNAEVTALTTGTNTD